VFLEKGKEKQDENKIEQYLEENSSVSFFSAFFYN